MAFIPVPQGDRKHRSDPWEPRGSDRNLSIVSPLLGAAYGLILASLPLYAFKDRANYADHIVRAAEIFNEFLSKGVLSAVFNEPLWWWLNHALFSLFGFEVTFRLIIALPAAIVAYRMLQQNKGALVWSLVFLLAPQVLKNHVVHLRQGVA